MKRHIWVGMLAVFAAMYAAWSAWQIFLEPLLNLTPWPAGLLRVAVKAAIWLLPMLAFLKREDWHISPKEMFHSPFPWFPCLVMLCISAVFLHTVRIVSGRLDSYVLWNHMFLLFSASAGIIEEISFRGFLFNRQAASLGTLPAAIVNGILFAVFHYPALILGQVFLNLLSWRFLMLLVVGILFSLAFAKWRNIWLTIVVHTVWNILSYLWTIA